VVGVDRSSGRADVLFLDALVVAVLVTFLALYEVSMGIVIRDETADDHEHSRRTVSATSLVESGLGVLGKIADVGGDGDLRPKERGRSDEMAITRLLGLYDSPAG